LTIDMSGNWWKGSEYADVEEYLRKLEPGGYPVDRVVQAQCACNGTRFELHVDQEEALAKTVSASCGRESFVSDSEDYWAEASPHRVECSCRHSEYDIGLGFCIRDQEWVRWMSLGVRCTRCGVLASPLDWKSDLQLTDPAATRLA